MGDVPGGLTSGEVHHEDIHPGLRRREGLLGIRCEQDPVDTQGEADPIGGFASEGLRESVVATPAAHGVLCGVEGQRGELEGRSPVVVESPHQALVDDIGDPERIEALPSRARSARRHRPERNSAIVGAVATTARSSGRLESSTRSGFRARVSSRCFGQARGVGLEVSPDGFCVTSAIVVLAERVQHESHLHESDLGEETPRQGDDLHVEISVVASKGLDTHLLEAPVAALLGTFVAEVGPRIEHLPRRQRLVLHERPHHARRSVRDATPPGFRHGR